MKCVVVVVLVLVVGGGGSGCGGVGGVGVLLFLLSSNVTRDLPGGAGEMRCCCYF